MASENPKEDPEIKKATEKAMVQGNRDVGTQRPFTLEYIDGLLTSDSERKEDINEQFSAGGLSIQLCEAKNIRSKQQDAYIVTEATSPNAPEFLKGAFDRIHKDLKDDPGKGILKESGAVANMCFVSKDNHITVANSGDCRTVMFVRNKTTGEVKPLRLSYDHKLEDPEIQRQVKRSRYTIEDGRIIGKYGKYRQAKGFGTTLCGAVDYRPDITHYQPPEAEKLKEYDVYVCTACDGLYGKRLSEEDYGRAMQVFLAARRSDSELAKLFIRIALAKGVGDNITLCITKLAPERTQDIVMGVSDGHGKKGEDVAKGVTDTMQKIAENSLKPGSGKGFTGRLLSRFWSSGHGH